MQTPKLHNETLELGGHLNQVTWWEVFGYMEFCLICRYFVGSFLTRQSVDLKCQDVNYYYYYFLSSLFCSMLKASKEQEFWPAFMLLFWSVLFAVNSHRVYQINIATGFHWERIGHSSRDIFSWINVCINRYIKVLVSILNLPVFTKAITNYFSEHIQHASWLSYLQNLILPNFKEKQNMRKVLIFWAR